MAVTRGQMNALLKRLEGPLRIAFVRAIGTARGRANINALIQAIAAGSNIDEVMAASGIRDGMWSSFSEQIRGAYAEAGAFVLTKDLPKRLATEFNINNPRAEAWLRNHSSQLITGVLLPEQRAAIQVMLRNGMVNGLNPRTVALDIVGRVAKGTGRRSGGILGLTEQQASYVVNMSDDLQNLDSRYFNRRLRDRRFDKLVQQSIDTGKPLPAKTRNKIIARYEDRLLKHRGDTVGRTEALRALNEASDEAMRQVVEEGLAPANAITRIWRHSFSANEREGHRLMNGQRRGVEESFNNPITGVVLARPGAGPGSETINCRCYVEHKIDFVAVEQAA